MGGTMLLSSDATLQPTNPQQHPENPKPEDIPKIPPAYLPALLDWPKPLLSKSNQVIEKVVSACMQGKTYINTFQNNVCFSPLPTDMPLLAQAAILLGRRVQGGGTRGGVMRCRGAERARAALQYQRDADASTDSTYPLSQGGEIKTYHS